jgi:hypothetical protein
MAITVLERTPEGRLMVSRQVEVKPSGNASQRRKFVRNQAEPEYRVTKAKYVADLMSLEEYIPNISDFGYELLINRQRDDNERWARSGVLTAKYFKDEFCEWENLFDVAADLLKHPAPVLVIPNPEYHES